MSSFEVNAVVSVVSFESCAKAFPGNPKNPAALNKKYRLLRLIVNVDGKHREARIFDRLNSKRSGISWPKILATTPKTLKVNVTAERVWVCVESIDEWLRDAKGQ